MDKHGIIMALLIIALVIWMFWAGATKGIEFGKDTLMKEAVKNYAAEFITNTETGKAEFIWKIVKPVDKME